MFHCSSCNLTFKSEKGLKCHKSWGCSEENFLKKCSACGKIFHRHSQLEIHYKTCEKIVEDNFVKTIEELQSQLDSMNFENQKIKEELNKQITSNDDLTKKNSSLHDEKIALQAQLDLLKETNQAKVVNNNYYSFNQQNNFQITPENVVQRLPCVSEKEIKCLFEKMPVAKLNSHEDMTDYLCYNYFNKRVISTDKNRNTLAYKLEDRAFIKDVGGMKLAEKINRIGGESKKNLDKKLADYDKTLDYTKPYNVSDITNKNYTLVTLGLNVMDNNVTISKRLGKHTKHIKNFTSLPEVSFENLKNNILNWCRNFEERVRVKEFIEFFVAEFCVNELDHSYRQSCNNLYACSSGNSEQNESKTFIFLDCCHAYFLDDANNIYEDHHYSQIFEILASFLCETEQLASTAKQSGERSSLDGASLRVKPLFFLILEEDSDEIFNNQTYFCDILYKHYLHINH